MGNICPKENPLLTKDADSTLANASTSSSSLSIDSDSDIELVYTPSTGEGECLKVLLSFLCVPYKEIIQNSKQHINTAVMWNNKTVVGTLSCLRHLSSLFGLYPDDEDDILTTEYLCEKIYALWQQVREDFYHNNRGRIHLFYTKDLPELLREVEKHVDLSKSGALCDQITMCDILLLTFVYNLFYRKSIEKYAYVLDRFPKVKALCVGILQNNISISSYFRTRRFNLYI